MTPIPVKGRLPLDCPVLSVIIVSWNVKEDLEKCLNSLRQNDLALEVIVVDNASTDGTVQMLAERQDVTVIANEENRGFAAANNQGLAVARGEYLLLLNPDTIVPAGGLQKLVDFAEKHPEAGIIGPRLLNPDGSLQYSCRRFPTIRAAMFRHTILGRLFPHEEATRDYLMQDWDHTQAREVDWVSGAALLIRRAAYDVVGGLDEGFFWGSEDVDYAFRMHQAGWKVLYSPEPAIIHAIGRSTDKAVVPTIIRTHRSMQRLYSKHLARTFLERVLVTVGVWLRAGLLLVSVTVAPRWQRGRRELLHLLGRRVDG